jgi:hypothetical protein
LRLTSSDESSIRRRSFSSNSFSMSEMGRQ